MGSASSLSGVQTPSNNIQLHPDRFPLSSVSSGIPSTLQDHSQNLKVTAIVAAVKLEVIGRKENGDCPAYNFKLPLQNHCQHNTGTLCYWTIQSGCDGGQDPLHLWSAGVEHKR